jgi:hypothetical protein
MKVLLGSRATGKTTKLVKLVGADPDALLIVPTMQEKKRIESQHSEVKGRIHTWASLKVQDLNPRKRLYVDNVEWFLREQFKGQLAGFSLGFENINLEMEHK